MFSQKKSLRSNKGQGLVEYLIIVALMGVATIGVIRLLNQTTNAQFATIINSLQGNPKKRVKMESVQGNDYKKKDLSNFMNGASHRKN